MCFPLIFGIFHFSQSFTFNLFHKVIQKSSQAVYMASRTHFPVLYLKIKKELMVWLSVFWDTKWIAAKIKQYFLRLFNLSAHHTANKSRCSHTEQTVSVHSKSKERRFKNINISHQRQSGQHISTRRIAVREPPLENENYRGTVYCIFCLGTSFFVILCCTSAICLNAGYFLENKVNFPHGNNRKETICMDC